MRRFVFLLQMQAQAEAGVISETMLADPLLVGWFIYFPEPVEFIITVLIIAQLPPGVEIEIVAEVCKQAQLQLVAAYPVPEGPDRRLDEEAGAVQAQLFPVLD